MSLEGRWVALAREWLLPRVPCSKIDYLISVSQFMPTHIQKRGNRRESDVSLSVIALRRIGAVIENGMVVSVPEKKATFKYDHQKRLNSFSIEDGIVEVNLGADVGDKERSAFFTWIRTKGDCVGRRKYKLR